MIRHEVLILRDFRMSLSSEWTKSKAAKGLRDKVQLSRMIIIQTLPCIDLWQWILDYPVIHLEDETETLYTIGISNELAECCIIATATR